MTGTHLARTASRLARGGCAALALGLLLAACSSSSGTVPGTGTGGGSTPAATQSTPAAIGPSSAPGAPATKSQSSKTNPFSGGGSSFCAQAKAEITKQAKSAEAITGDSPQALEKFEKQAVAELQLFVAKAPSQIRAAAQTIATAENKLFSALKAANWDFTKLSPTLIQSFDTPKFEQAGKTIENYFKDTCGISDSSS